MANGTNGEGAWRLNPWRVLGWGTAAALLLTPLIAMRFTSEVNWTASDFALAGVMIGGVPMSAKGRVPCGARPSFALLAKSSSDDVDAADCKRPAMAHSVRSAMLGHSAEVGQ